MKHDLGLDGYWQIVLIATVLSPLLYLVVFLQENIDWELVTTVIAVGVLAILTIKGLAGRKL